MIRECLADIDGARSAFERAFALSRTLTIPRTEARALINLGNLALTVQSEQEAKTFFEDSLQIVRPLDDKRSMAAAIIGLGRCALRAGSHKAALTHCRESLTLYREADEKPGIVSVLLVLAETAFALSASAAPLLLTTAKALRDETGTQFAPQESERVRHLEESLGPHQVAPDLTAALAAAEKLGS